MKVTYFFRPTSVGVYSIEIVFQNILSHLPNNIEARIFRCTTKWKRYNSFLKAGKFQGEVNHITGDIHTIALFLNGNKTILTVHDIGRYERNLKGIRKWIIKKIWLEWPLNRVKYITTISEYTKQKLLNVCKISPSKIFVIPNPANTDFVYSPKEFNSEKPVILQIGSSPVKNVERLIDAVVGINCKLLLVRKTDDSLIQKLDSAGLCYEIRQNLTRSEVYDCYRESDILFFASEHEGFGVPILEANSVGRPVITSNLAPMKDVAGDAALLIDPFSVNEIRRAILNLCRDEKLRMDLIKNGITNLSRFTTEGITDQYVQLYKQMITENNN